MKTIPKIILIVGLSLIFSTAWMFPGVPYDPSKKVVLNIPFLCQAPYANWDQPWQDACEEAAVIMAIHYVNENKLDKEIGNQAILDLVKFQKQKYGGHYDLTAKLTAKLMKDFYQFSDFNILYEFDVQTIKQELDKGNVVFAPMAGRMLGNRFYRQPGPAYHYLVFKGYDDNSKEFITNDPGTKRGNGYRYKYEIAFNAIHDWNGSKETIKQGPKALIVVKK
jgi:hypothetical protein